MKDIISTWSASRVNQYLSDFARSNDLKLATPSPQISGNLFFSSISYSMCDYFESASDLDVIKLYYQIHPTEVNVPIWNSCRFPLATYVYFLLIPSFNCVFISGARII